MLLKRNDGYYWKAFFLSFLTATLIIIPFIISGKGILYIVDDFNLQQIPFNVLSNESIKSGNIFWSWNTDLGSNFIGAYSFYTLGSPYFWLSLIFSAKLYPYLIGPMLIFKFSIAGLTSYAYIQRFVKNKNYALIGSLLYAFSGFQISNMMFNHFQDVVSVFPLLLIAFEELMQHDRKNFLCIMVAVCALLNYFFFVGEVVFLFLYFIVKLLSKEFPFNIKKFIRAAFESIVGVGISAVILIPSVLFTSQNPRSKTLIFERNIFKYPFIYYLHILQSFLMPPEIMSSRSILFEHKWDSVAAFLPLFSIILVMAYILTHKKDWLSFILIICIIFAFVPVLNQAFYLFKTAYYGRWYYMMILVMALASAKILDDKKPKLISGFLATIFVWMIFVVLLVIWKYKYHQKIIFNYEYLRFYLIMAAMSLILSFILLSFKRKKIFSSITICFIIILASISGIFNIRGNQKFYPPSPDLTKIYTQSLIKLPAGDNYRIDTDKCYHNISILWNIPCVTNFNSTVNGSIFEFYQSVGIDRTNYSTIPYSQNGLRSFLSVKYIVVPQNSQLKDNLNPLKLKKYSTQDGYDIYENLDYIPIGFTFDSYISQEQYNKTDPANRHLYLLKSIVLNSEQILKYKNILDSISINRLYNISDTAFENDVANRNSETCDDFKRENNGFSTKINLKKDNLIFFSIPYDKGWTAEINGKPAVIEEVDNGFMAVKGNAGENKLIFHYCPPGLKTGALISLISVILLISSVTFYTYKKRRIKIISSSPRL